MTRGFLHKIHAHLTRISRAYDAHFKFSIFAPFSKFAPLLRKKCPIFKICPIFKKMPNFLKKNYFQKNALMWIIWKNIDEKGCKLMYKGRHKKKLFFFQKNSDRGGEGSRRIRNLLIRKNWGLRIAGRGGGSQVFRVFLKKKNSFFLCLPLVQTSEFNCNCAKVCSIFLNKWFVWGKLGFRQWKCDFQNGFGSLS